MMKYLLAASVALVPVTAHAIERYRVEHMTCESVRATLRRDHAAILQHVSPRSGVLLYDRYVSDSRYCPAYTSTVADYLPTLDDPSCRVYHCIRTDDFMDAPGSR